MSHFTHKALLAAAAIFFAYPAMADAAKVEVKSSGKYDAFLADAEGRSLYLFKADTRGKDGKDAVSACYDKCAVAWPPLTTTGEPTGGDKVKSELLGTIERKDGTMQVTYGGWPLYYFVKDKAPGDTNGQDVEGFGEEWYLVAPGGKKVAEHGDDHGKDHGDDDKS
jgi:predicted lipoprotein with Yx(FWY)xxD motif